MSATVFVFIFESIGTQELVLIGIIALILLGPRQLPQIAKKIGKIMAEFRSTTQEFKSTWEREVNFEEEERALRRAFEDEPPAPVARENSILPPAAPSIAPEIKEIDPARFQDASAESSDSGQDGEAEPEPSVDLEAKQNWL